MNVIISRNQPTYDSGLEVEGQKLVLTSISKNDFDALADLGKDNKLDGAYAFVFKILNKNTAGIVLTQEEVNQIDYITVANLLKGYTAFLKGFGADPN